MRRCYFVSEGFLSVARSPVVIKFAVETDQAGVSDLQPALTE